MARQDSDAVRAFKAFGMRHSREQLAVADGRFVDTAASYEAVVAALKAEYGWPQDLAKMERTVGGKHREVCINRLHWMTARLCLEGVIETGPFPARRPPSLAAGAALRAGCPEVDPHCSEVAPCKPSSSRPR
jgi:hypothetical protein